MTTSSRTQATIGERVACLRYVSYAERNLAVNAANGIAQKTGCTTEIISCPTCRGFHIKTKRAS